MRHSAGKQAEEFLRRALAQGPLPVAEIVERASREGIARATLYRAMKRLRVERIPTGEGRYKWAVPGQPADGAPNESAPVAPVETDRRAKLAAEEVVRLIRAGMNREYAIYQVCRGDTELMQQVRAELDRR